MLLYVKENLESPLLQDLKQISKDAKCSEDGSFSLITIENWAGSESKCVCKNDFTVYETCPKEEGKTCEKGKHHDPQELTIWRSLSSFCA